MIKSFAFLAFMSISLSLFSADIEESQLLGSYRGQMKRTTSSTGNALRYDLFFESNTNGHISGHAVYYNTVSRACCDVQHCGRISGVFNTAMNQAEGKNAV